MLQKIKSNFLIRKILYKLLVRHNTSRKYKVISKQLYFDAGKNFNLFFSKYVDIEPQIRKNISKFVKSNFLVFDVGANIGYYTIYLSCLCNEGKIIAIEPDSGNIKYLKQNIQKNNCDNVFVIESAVSDKKGIHKFYIDKSTGRTSSLEHDMWHPNSSEIKEETVNTITLDDLTILHGIPSLIKCDVEGHEVAVLEGAKETLKHKPVLFLEVREKNRESVQNILKKCSYRFFNAEEPFNDDFPLKEINTPNVICI